MKLDDAITFRHHDAAAPACSPPTSSCRCTTSRWWDGLVTEVPAGFTAEDGRRTFALNEIMVHPERQRQGIARALHDELLSGRPERRSTR